MSPQTGDDASSPDPSRPGGGLANVFRGLTGSKLSKSPPPLSSSSSAALTRTDFVNATPTTSRTLSANHAEAFEILKNGSPNERIEAANTLKYAITEYPLNPVLEIWDAAKDLIDPIKTASARTAGWELLTECAKHDSATDLERREYFQTLSAPANADDFHLQLAALVDLTNRGRVVTGFDYELLPLLTRWLQEAYNAARAARRNGAQTSRGSKSSSRGRTASTGEEKNFTQLFSFVMDVIKFSFNCADEASVTGLIDALLRICMNTSAEDDLRSCIGVVDAIVTFGSIPNSKLKDCVQVLSSIFCLVPGLYKDAWHTIANLCRSHNGQATVRILLDILRNLPSEKTKEKDPIREVRGALAVLQKLLLKSAEKGYPTVPYALLFDGLSTAAKGADSIRVYTAILQLINSLFDDGEGEMQRLLVDEDWSAALDVAVECSRKANANLDNIRLPQGKDEVLEETVNKELLILINQLNVLFYGVKSRTYIPRQTIVKFFTEVHQLLPDNAARTVLDYFQEFRCCSPSDLHWEENLSLVLRAFFSNRARSSDTRLRALQATMDAYEIVDLVGDGAEQTFIPRLAKNILQDVAEETDIKVLDAVMSLMSTVVMSCDSHLFDYIIDTLRGIVVNDRLKSPIEPSPMSSPFSATASATDRPSSSPTDQSPSNVVIRGYVKMFAQLMNSHSEKSVKLYNVLVSVAKASHCEVDARLTAMKLLFRLRADWANRVFVTRVLETDFLAASICRTDASLAKKQAEEAAANFRHSRSDHGAVTRSSRGISFSQGQPHERGVPIRSSSSINRPVTKYQQRWKAPDPDALPDNVPRLISPVLVSQVAPRESSAGEGSTEEKPGLDIRAINTSVWLEAVLGILKGCDWEVYSFALVHLPSQLSNHAIFTDAIPQVQELRRLICEQIRTNSFQEPPNASGLRRADVAICLYHSLTMILSYHEHFQKSEEDEMVRTFVLGIATWERSAKCCIHALSICCHELPISTSKSLVQMLNQMAAIITQPHVSVHILEFLACLSRLHHIYVNFREDEYRIVFAICFRYLEYAREKNQLNRNSHASEPSTPATSGPTPLESAQASPPEELPQYVHALAYHVILFWFLALKLPDRATHVGWIIRKLFADADASGQTADEQTITSIDFLQRVTYADVEESKEDPLFTEARFGEIIRKRWLIGNSIVTVKQAKLTGWAHIIKRQPSGTSAYTIRENYGPPPPHQVGNHVDISREGQQAANAILPSHLLVQLMSPIPQTFESARPIPLPDDDATQRTLNIFDRQSTVDGHKVGVIYIGEGQTGEAEILANVSGSSDYVELLNNLGTLTRLKGAKFNTQGLDHDYDSDGQYTFCWRDRVTEIMFHVTTQMPTRPEDPSGSLKKRHIGNDFVNIIFNDSGLPFKFDTFPSQFNFVNIVITPASRASFIAARQAKLDGGKGQPFYRVQVMSKPGFPEISPAAETKMVSLKALPGFIRLLALNASMFSLVWHNREGGEHISSWSARLREIKRLRERHGPRAAGTAPSPPPTSLGGAAAGQQFDASRPSSTVRDSFTSLRRTSVATFFTSASEQPSHRSSTLSASTTTNDTEVGMANGMGALVDSVDFSKWS